MYCQLKIADVIYIILLIEMLFETNRNEILD